MRRTKELPRKIRNLSGYCLSGLALAGITMCKGAFNVKTKLLSWLLTLSLLMTMLPTAAFAADGTPENTYEVSTAEELSTELTNIAASTEDEATIVLKADITLSNDATSGYISFGANGKHITVKSDEGEMKKLSFPSYGVLTGDCTFDNVYVIGR